MTFELLLTGLCLFRFSPTEAPDQLLVHLVNATESSPAFTEKQRNGCACDGTELYAHHPYLNLRLEDLNSIDLQNGDKLIAIAAPDGSEAARISLLGRYVWFESDSDSELSLPKKRNPKHFVPKFLGSSKKALASKAHLGWQIPLQLKVEESEAALRSDLEPGQDKRVAAEILIETGAITAANTSKVPFGLQASASTHEMVAKEWVEYSPKSVSDRVLVKMKNISSLTINISPCKKGAPCYKRPTTIQLHNDKKVLATISNLPAETQLKSDETHFAWMYELVEWQGGCPFCLPLLTDSQRPLKRNSMGKKAREGRCTPNCLRAGSNAICPGAQWP